MAGEIRSYATAFLLTIAAEVAVAVAMGYRKRAEIASVVWVNMFSHPLLVCFLWTIGSLRLSAVSLREVAWFETGVVFVEWGLLCYALPLRARSALFILSLAMNSVSYLAGVILLG